MSTEKKFEDWWKENAPKHAPDVTLADVERVSLLSVVEQIPKAPFAFANAAEYVVDVKGSPPVIINADSSLIVSTKLILPGTISLDLAGLGKNNVALLYATFSSKAQSLVLDATMVSQDSQPTAKVSVTITTFSDTASSYLQAVGYTNPKPPSLAAFLSSAVGSNTASSFFATLPSPLSSLISLPTWSTDLFNSEVSFTLEPFGAVVQKAILDAILPASLKVQLAGLTFEVKRAAITVARDQVSYQSAYDISLNLDASLTGASGVILEIKGLVSRLDKGPFRFSLEVSSPSTLANIFTALTFPSVPNPIPLPLGGPTLAQNIPLSAIGISLVQSCTGATSSLQVDEVFFKFDIGVWKPWEYLPTSLQPKKASDVTLGVIIKPSPTNIGLQFGYLLDFPETSSSIKLQITCWPIQAEKTFTAGTVPLLSVRFDTYGLKPPSIGTVLQKIFNSSWDSVTGAIPIVGDLTDAISIVEANLDIAKDSGNKPSITAFTIRARVDSLTLLKTPSLIITSANLAVIYENKEWKAAFATNLLFADKFICTADLLLPTKTEPGYFRFDNLDDAFTFDELAKSIDPSIDLATVPIIGSDALKTLRLGHLLVQVQYIQNVLRLSAFEVEITWESQNIGQIRTAANILTIRWQKLTDTQSWSISWQGQIGTSWQLSAAVQYVSTGGKKRVVVGGDISNIRGRTPASELVNSLTWTAADSGGNSKAWEDTIPSTVHPDFSLDRCSLLLDLGETSIHMAAAQASWGKDAQMAAVLLVEKVSTSWGFTFALAVKNFRFTDIYKDSQLAQLVDRHLTISTAFVVAFRSPTMTKLSAVRQRLYDLGAWEKIDSGTTLPPLEPFIDTGVQLGLVILASLNIGASPSGSLSNNLAVIDSKLATSNITLSCYISKAVQTTVAFVATITSIQVVSALLVKSVKLSFIIPVSKTSPSTTKFDLEAECVVQFSETQTWSLLGKSTITESTASLSFSTTGNSLLELGALQLKNIALGVDYTFSSSGKTGDDTPNEGVVKYGDRYGKYLIKLSAAIALGSVQSIVYLIFMSGSVGALVVTVPGTLNIGVLFQSIFGSGFPAEILDISFTNLLIYYAWNANSKTPAGQPGPGSGKYIKGFHAEANTSVYGIAFILSADIFTIGDKTGIQIMATKATPVEVICITLHAKDVTTKGPSFGLSTIDKGCFIESGISFLGTELGSIKLTYSKLIPGLRGDVAVKAKFLPGGSANVSFEIVWKNGKNRLRFVGLPGIFDDIINVYQLIETIRDLSKVDGSPCGAITLAFDQLVKSKVSVGVQLSNSQSGQSPEEGIPPGVKTVKFDVTGRFDLYIGNHSITNVVFNPLTFTVNIPRSLDSFGDSLAYSLKQSIADIVKGLWDDKEKLAEVIALVALKELSAKAIATLICRDYYKPSANPNDPPDSDQKPDKPDDGGGPDGDTGPSSGGSDGGVASTAGSTAASAAKALGAALSTLAGILAGLFGIIPALVPSIPRPPPARPHPPGSLNPPVAGDPYAQQIYDALKKDFDRWSKETEYKKALQTALQCSLDYLNALDLLRKVVTNPTAVKNLGKKQMEDYKRRRAHLVYGFSQLRPRFADKWLDMSNKEVSLQVVVKDGGQRELQVKWNSLYSDESLVTPLTLYINDTAQVKMQKYNDNTMTTPVPAFSLQGLRVTAKVVGLAATWDDKQTYAFYCQGRPATGMFTELPPTTTTLDSTKQPWPPAGLKYFNLIDPDKLDSDAKHYPVFRVGTYVYWALSYRDNRDAMAILVYDQDNKLVRRWTKTGARYIWKITVENKKVTFYGQSKQSVEFTFDELLSIPLVTTADSTKQPTPPQGLKYETLLEDGMSKKYPVVDFLGHRFWALSFVDNRIAFAILKYDQVNKLVGRVDKPGARYIARITVQDDKVNFIGQYDNSVISTINELHNMTLVDPTVPWVTTGDANDQPDAPDGLNYTTLDGDHSKYPVLRYSGLTYWALSYIDNRVSMCILGYDGGMNIVKNLQKSGARYISRIVVDGSTVKFIGQADQSVSFTLKELAP